MISVRIRIVHVRHRHMHNRVLPVAQAVTSPSASVNALANDNSVNFTCLRKLHFAESISGLFKCTRKNILLNLSTESTTTHCCCSCRKQVVLKMSILILNQVSWVISVLVTWQWPLRRSRSLKVTDFGTNRKRICDFLIVINSNLSPVLHRFRDIASERSKIAIFGYSSSV